MLNSVAAYYKQQTKLAQRINKFIQIIFYFSTWRPLDKCCKFRYYQTLNRCFKDRPHANFIGFSNRCSYNILLIKIISRKNKVMNVPKKEEKTGCDSP